MVGEVSRSCAFYVDSSGGILHEEIGRRDIVRYDTANAHPASRCSFIRSKVPHLVRVSE